MHHSLVASHELFANANRVHGRSFDYEIGTPIFLDTDNLDFTLTEQSPGYSAGPNGVDMGAMIPAGASISGEPTGITSSPEAELTIGGPGIFSFLYRINEEPWSKEITIGDPRDYESGQFTRSKTIQLQGLQPGEYTVYVRGRNFAGELQKESQATRSKTWTVQ